MLEQLASFKMRVAPGSVAAPEKLGTHSLVAELWGLRDGLTLPKNLNIQKLIIEVDTLTVAKFFTSENARFNSSHPYNANYYH